MVRFPGVHHVSEPTLLTTQERGVLWFSEPTLPLPHRSRAGRQMVRFIFFDLTLSICRDGVKRKFLVRVGLFQPYLEQLPGGGGKVVEGALPLLRKLHLIDVLEF